MSDYMPKCATCEHFESCIIQKHLTEMALILWNISKAEDTADRKTDNSSEKPNNCEDCANGEGDIEACGYCRHGDLYEPKTEPTSSKMEQVEEPKICDTCRYYNSNIPCGSTPSACKKADKFAEEFVDGLKKLKQTEPTSSKMEQVDEPKTQMKTQNSNLTFEKADEPQTDCSWK